MFSSNIRPVRDLLRSKADDEDARVPWFPYVPSGRRRSTQVAIGADDDIAGGPSGRRLGPLEGILMCPPLLDAFDSFCQKALCGEVSMHSTKERSCQVVVGIVAWDHTWYTPAKSLLRTHSKLPVVSHLKQTSACHSPPRGNRTRIICAVDYVSERSRGLSCGDPPGRQR